MVIGVFLAFVACGYGVGAWSPPEPPNSLSGFVIEEGSASGANSAQAKIVSVDAKTGNVTETEKALDFLPSSAFCAIAFAIDPITKKNSMYALDNQFVITTDVSTGQQVRNVSVDLNVLTPPFSMPAMSFDAASGVIVGPVDTVGGWEMAAIDVVSGNVTIDGYLPLHFPDGVNLCETIVLVGASLINGGLSGRLYWVEGGNGNFESLIGWDLATKSQVTNATVLGGLNAIAPVIDGSGVDILCLSQYTPMDETANSDFPDGLRVLRVPEASSKFQLVALLPQGTRAAFQSVATMYNNSQFVFEAGFNDPTGGLIATLYTMPATSSYPAPLYNATLPFGDQLSKVLWKIQ